MLYFVYFLSLWSTVPLSYPFLLFIFASNAPGASAYSDSYSMRRHLRRVFVLSRARWERIGGTLYALLSQFEVPSNHHWQQNNGSHLSSLNCPSWAGCGCISGNGYWLTSSQGSLWPSCTSLRVRRMITIILLYVQVAELEIWLLSAYV